MIIQDNILSVVNILFKDKQKWAYITAEQKNKYFFIVNRYMSKKFPEKSMLLNNKNIDKVSAMDTWYYFMLSLKSEETYPKWFWSKSEKKIDKNIDDNEIKYLLENFNLNLEDLNILIKYYPDIVKEELKYFKDSLKNKK